MYSFGKACIAGLILLVVAFSAAWAEDRSFYVKKDTWLETVVASREALMQKEKVQGGGLAVDLGREDFTVSAWIKTTERSGVIWSKTPDSGAWEIGSKALFISEDQGNLLYAVSVPVQRRRGDPDRHTDEETVQGGAYAVGQLQGVDIRDGEWHHVAITGGKIAKFGDRYQFYVDGAPVQSLTLRNFKRMGPDDPKHDFQIGGSVLNFRLSRRDVQVPAFSGDIDEVQIFSRKLSSEEINALYDNPGAVSDALVGWWPFEDGASDASFFANDGEAINVTSVSGKTGKALRFNGKSKVSVPAIPGKESRDKIFELAARDFPGEDIAAALKWEQEDGIWKIDWKVGDLKLLASRYADACRDILKAREKAAPLAKGVHSSTDLKAVREVYLSARQIYDHRVAAKKQGDFMLKEIDYLDDLHDPDDTRWKEYKNSTRRLVKERDEALRAIDEGDAAAAEKLAKVNDQLVDLHANLPHKLPSGPLGPARFGAVYSKLKYTLKWDERWRVSKDADIVVQFAEGPYKLVFWRGCSYIPAWATQHDGPWFTNEFFERRGWLGGGDSMMEPMSDKQCRYSHVRLVEDNDARVVVHWRYTPSDLNYNLGYIDPETKWGDWADEYYTIYPDGVAIRSATLFSSGPLTDWIEYHESIFINQPGTRPSDNIPLEAVTLANLKGETHTYKWEMRGPASFDEPTDPCIQLVNFRTKYKHFSVVSTENLKVTAYPKDSRFSDSEHFNTWDAWPVSQDWSDARKATDFRQVSHSNLTHIRWKPYIQNEQKRTWIMMIGMTDKSAGELAPLGRSWLQAPALNVEGSAYVNEGYKPEERAYVLDLETPNRPKALKGTLNASEDSPVVNAALVVKNWGEQGASLTLNGKEIPQGKGFRVGHRHAFETSDLVVWIRVEATKPVTLALVPAAE